ncbi:MAG: DUF5677 domain-containing protein [Candidatus Binataceae bacterium]
MSQEETDEQLFRVGFGLSEELITRLKRARLSGRLNYKRAMLFFFCKSFKTYQGSRLLWQAGFPEDAANLARSIYELRLQTIYLSQNPDERSKLFIKHWIKTGYGTFLHLMRAGERTWRPDIQAAVEEVRQAAVRVGCPEIIDDPEGAEKAIAQKWWGKGGIKGLTKELDCEKEYETTYSILSDYSHSAVRVFHVFVQLSEASISVQCRPAKDSRLLLPFSMTAWLIQIVGYTGQAFDLGLDDLVHQAENRAISLYAPDGEAVKKK